MNKTRIDWCDFTWNPITGCRGGCFYCYARRISERFGKSFKPTFHPERLLEPLSKKKPSKIFVCSMSDFWGDGVKQEWRDAVYEVIKQCPQHTFLILTKKPGNITAWDRVRIPTGIWVGVSYTTFEDRFRLIDFLFGVNIPINPFVSIEPILNDCAIDYLLYFKWIIIGAMTGPGSAEYAPQREWIRKICNEVKAPVFMKRNLKPYWDGKLRQEWPEGMK